ncbi:hypothetical protein Tco_0688647 [Tanacetum coccineum]
MMATIVDQAAQWLDIVSSSNARLETTFEKLNWQTTIPKKEPNDSTIDTNTNITETKTTHVVTDTSSLVTKINKPDNTILKLLTDPTVQNEVFAQIPFSPLSGLPANPSHKTSKLRNYITIFPQTTIHETYGVATFIDYKLPIFGCLELFPISGQCHPPKFVFLEPKLDPPWEPHDRHYETMSLEDKTHFKTGSIDTCMMS